MRVTQRARPRPASTTGRATTTTTLTTAGAASHSVPSYRTTETVTTPVTDNRGRVCGYLSDDGWLFKQVDRHIHQLRQPPSWATDLAHVERLAVLGAHGIRLHDEQGQTWEATLEQFREHSVPISRGYGAQLALPLRWWRVTAPGQLSLFGEAAP
jgi:hypothetical protein